MKSLHLKFLLIIPAVFFFSCTPAKKIIYLQDKGSGSSTTAAAYEHHIKAGEELYIRITPADEQYSLSLSNSGAGSNEFSTEIGLYLNSYEVSDSGFIRMPLLGRIEVAGLSLNECRSKVQRLADQYLKNALVNVRLANFNITILGEVKNPGTYKIYSSSVNIFEALGYAGDLNDNGNRRKILITRKSEQSKVSYIDITDRSIIGSAYYYLEPGDVIYVQPTRSKIYGTNPFPLAAILSSVTTLLLILNYVNQ